MSGIGGLAPFRAAFAAYCGLLLLRPDEWSRDFTALRSCAICEAPSLHGRSLGDGEKRGGMGHVMREGSLVAIHDLAQRTGSARCLEGGATFRISTGL